MLDMLMIRAIIPCICLASCGTEASSYEVQGVPVILRDGVGPEQWEMDEMCDFIVGAYSDHFEADIMPVFRRLTSITWVLGAVHYRTKKGNLAHANATYHHDSNNKVWDVAVSYNAGPTDSKWLIHELTHHVGLWLLDDSDHFHQHRIRWDLAEKVHEEWLQQ